MAWVVDVSRCLGLVEIKGCPAARLVQQQVRDSGQDIKNSSSGSPPITDDVTSITCAADESRMNSHDMNLEPAEAVTDSGSSTPSSGEESSSQDEENILHPEKNLTRLESVSTPCLLDITRFKILCSPNSSECKASPKRSFSTVEYSCPSSAAKITFCDIRKPLTQSCEVLAPSPSTKLLERLRLAAACSRRVVLSKGDCTVQYSPITTPASVLTVSGLQESGADLCNTPRSSLRKYSRVASPDASAAGRSALMDRVCGIGNGVQSGVPPLPATEHPTRPPRIDLCCSQHIEPSCFSDRPYSNYHSSRNCSNRQHGRKETTARRAVKSASGLLQNNFCASVRSWSEFWLAGESADSSEMMKLFQENRTSSLRGPPSRAASADLLLNSLDLSDVSVGDHCGGGDDDRPMNGDDGSCRIPIPCDCSDTPNTACSHEQPCSSCGVLCSCRSSNSVQVLASNSRQSVASTSSTTISSSLDSSNTSVTTISYGGSTQHPSFTYNASESAQCPCAADSRNNGVCSCGGSNRGSFHVPQSCLHSSLSSVPPKIRRCQSDITSSTNNVSGAGRGSLGSKDSKPCDKDTAGNKVSNRARLAATGRAMTDCGAGERRSERRSGDETANRNKSLKRSQGSTHLRRSVSQPLDLNKSPVEGGTGGPLRISTRPACGASRHLHSYPHKRPQRRPSTGNLLNDEHTTSEEELLPSDNEEARRERTIDESCGVVYAEALWDHVTMDSEELMFRAGELISVVDRTDHDWWWGRISTRSGWFPVAFVRLLVNQQEHLVSSQELEVSDSRDDLTVAVNQIAPEEQLDTTLTDRDAANAIDALSSGVVSTSSTSGCGRGYTRAVSQFSTGTTPRKASVSGPTHDQIRANVIKEIITTERDFVKHLRDVVEGYLRQARRRPDMFSAARISAIFGNMEDLYAFQTRFLSDLEVCIDWEVLHKSCVGEAFIKNSDKFEIYSEYCNNHPFAVSELQELYQQEKYVHFFEACRLLQEMIDISLDGFLLTPVQKICKYPLQLQELLKYTKPDHPDHTSVQGALNAMRSAALMVNERRRRMECLEKIAAWQMELEGWEGAELLDSSSQLLHQGEVVKSAGGAWPKEVTLFLFDRLLVYCKKDIIKRNTYVYRGRINLDQCTVEEIGESKDGSRSNYVPNAWRIRCRDKNKSYVFACKTCEEKTKWLEAFRRERELVAGDEEAGFLVSDKTRELAREAARTRRARPKKPRSSKMASKRCQALTHAQAEMLVNIDVEQRSNSLPSHQQQVQQLGNTAPLSATIVSADTSSDNKRRGLWFGFGGQKKSRSQSRGDQQQTGQQPQPTLV